MVIMQSVKPAPNKTKEKSVPIPELSLDENETTIDVMDYRK